ncbi:ABC transporter G family member 23 [Hondaea fermentalgiana]|uniref:ABC transporter G family member 23 n=1 Tax=Hondaea fermentalgiana TaxID=2315210 RepID=A0A2R5GPF6_9STRA|nr:ABC transporter G family member 23 [Hondaea fermentalgiana]|eukprot:GBG30503.1 ABC transporter G family member 23 [Hondaea fermentalgiana]
MASQKVSPEPDELPVLVLELRNLSRDVKVPGKGFRRESKRILHNFNARFTSGELCAVMGGSGGGKSSLLSEIAKGSDAMRLNGQPLPQRYRDAVCVIPQADILFPALTPRQSLRYSAMLRLPSSAPASQIEEVVDRLISDLSLTKCKDTPVGDENRRGVSGGERKRVSIGTELVVNPSILLVDEPSSGLDSTTAEGVVELLRRLAKEHGQMVICTIHQPSYKLFCSFDKLLLLHHGRVVYNGRTQQPLHDYFISIGFKSPEFENPLDYYMRVLQEREEEDQDFFANKWAELDDAKREALDTPRHPTASASGVSEAAMAKMTARNSWMHQFTTLLRRFFQDTLRDKTKFAQNLMLKLMTGTMLGIVFVNQARETSLDSAFERTSPLFFLVISGILDTAFAAILVLPLTRPLLVREYRNGAYSVSSLFAAQICTSLFFDPLSSLAYSVAIPIVGLYPSVDQFLKYLLVSMVMTAFGSALGLMLGSTSKDVMEAQNKLVPVLMPLLLFCGFLIRRDKIPIYFRWLYYVSPFQWSLSALLVAEFEPLELVDASGNVVTGSMYLAGLGLEVDEYWRDIGVLGGLTLAMFLFAFINVRIAIHKQAKDN